MALEAFYVDGVTRDILVRAIPNYELQSIVLALSE
jgi:hypothetical protein